MMSSARPKVAADTVANMQVSTDELYHLVMAAHYLDVPRLLDLCTDAMADHIRGKSPDQVRECFGLKPNLSPEEVCGANSACAYLLQVLGHCQRNSTAISVLLKGLAPIVLMLQKFLNTVHLHMCDAALLTLCAVPCP